MSLLRENRRIGLLCLLLVLAALFLAGPAHTLMHHDGGPGDLDQPDDCQLCHVHFAGFEVMDLVPASLEPAHLGLALVQAGPFATDAGRSAAPRAPPLA